MAAFSLLRRNGAERTAWARNVAAPVRDFLGTETGSAIVLVAAALVALAWANVAPDNYADVWATELRIELGSAGIAADLREWVNEGLMALFFLVIGLEAKRELDLGELRERSRVWIPAAAAVGGAAASVGVYLLFNAGGGGAGGWGVAMSTDTALALGVLALITSAGATRLRVFMLTVAVVDDLLTLLVIAFVYTESIDSVALVVAIGLFAVLALLRFAPSSARGPLAVLVGTAIWVAVFESGVDAIIAGLAIGLVTSAYPPARDDLERATDLTKEFREQPTPGLSASARRSLAEAISPNERLQYMLHPWTSYAVVPIFVLANAGVHVTGSLLSDAIASPITLGIVAAYAIGKPIGVFVIPWLATRRAFGGGKLSITWPGLLGTGAAAGVGFTVSILIANLAFEGADLEEAKVGIIAAALISTLLALAVFQGTRLLVSTNRRLQQVGRTAEEIIDLSDDVDPDRDHVRGDPDAIVTLVEYADFECPYCGRAEPTIRELLANRETGLRYVFRHLPLNDVHPHAQLASEAAEAASAQGAFWPMHDLLLDHQGALDYGHLREYAQQLDLDLERFEAEIRDRSHRGRVTEDVVSADASGVSGTPTFFVNGRRHHGVYDIGALTQAIKRAKLRAAGRQRAAAIG